MTVPMEVHVWLADEPELRKAVFGVLELHKPTTNSNIGYAFCQQCGFLPYPCTTVKVVKAALKGDL